ncbi:glyoxalase [Sulfuricella sp. T08]|uniref:VOC family protein n=1 Tax=Sulfuricella sp. T08 TaxID=1632857 RepID=UPI000617971C|nr:VOC family protein [Sulfuricella sp. T08]GAO35583.1 glyoxalase [Sulfuricella sp. T08]
MTTPPMKLLRIKAIALAVTDLDRAIHFYTDTLSLRPAFEEGKQVGNYLGDTVLMFKKDWYAQPSDALNPRVTIETEDARSTESALRARDVVIADPVERYGESLVGSFLDSEGNKLWFCSGPEPT